MRVKSRGSPQALAPPRLVLQTGHPAREQGRDIEEIFDDLQTEEALARQYGIDLTTPPATPLNPKQEQLPA